MPKLTERERVQGWQSKVNAANKVYAAWAQKYVPDTLENYYYGHQHLNDETAEIENRQYVINLFYPSINIRKPSLLFFRPKVRVDARPGRNDDPGTDVEARARLQQDTINTYIGTRSLGFHLETSLAVQDAHFRFGVCKVEYNADIADNPLAGKPMTKEGSTDSMHDEGGLEVMQPAKLVEDESLYIKWIPGQTFRVSVNQSNDLKKCDWVGYFEWHHAVDVKAEPRYKNTKDIKGTGAINKDFQGDEWKGPPDEDPHAGMVKLWKLWSLRRDKDGKTHRIVFADGGEKFLLDEPYKVFPFAGLVFDNILRQWYPLPPTFNWLHPQNELNESREGLRAHRRKFKRQFQRQVGSVQPEELDKWKEAEDGTCVEVTGEGIRPIDNATSDPSLVQSIPQSYEDFTRISGVSGEDQAVAQSETATQANILDVRSRIRESYGRVQVSNWLGEIAFIMLQTLKEDTALPLWIKMNADTTPPSTPEEAMVRIAEVMRIGKLWKQINGDELGELSNDISVDIESLSPVAEETERNSFNQLLAIVTNPTVALFLSQSEVLLRKALGYYGVKSEKEIQEVKRAMEMTLQLQMMAQAGAAGGAAGAGPQGASPGPTPDNTAIADQIQAQMPQRAM